MDNYNLFEVFSQTAEQLFRDVDLSPAMVYLVDTVNANALPFLAAQFDVEGFKGWNLATTDTQKRDLIKSAIELKRKRGTPFAIKRALASIGFTNVEIQEGIQVGLGPFNYDGEYNYDGTIMHGGFSWASFRVIISVQDVTHSIGFIELSAPVHRNSPMRRAFRGESIRMNRGNSRLPARFEFNRI